MGLTALANDTQKLLMRIKIKLLHQLKTKRARLKSASSKIAITAEKSNTLCT